MPYPTVTEVVSGSPASVAGLAVGDELISICGVRPSDVIEYQQLVDEAEVEMTVRRGGLEWDITLEKAAGEPLGLRLDSSIFDRVQTCDNHCEFCFIYQLPPGMRKSLYLKDDDYRLSFLYGNFTTLTRFTELDLARVLEERLSPLYVSIHATEPAVRERMLRNRRGSTSLRWLRALLDGGIEVHGQVVLCPGVNDGDILERTFGEILARYRRIASVGIVPLGLSRYNGEPGLRPHTPDEARRVVDRIHVWQAAALDYVGRRLFFGSDELYLQAGAELPEADAYEGFPQHENGIGMARTFYEELAGIERGTSGHGPSRTGEWRWIPAAPAAGYRATRTGGNGANGKRTGPAVLVTGEYGALVLAPVLGRLSAVASTPLRLLTVRNEFFGGNTAVTGLLVGEDIIAALRSDQGDAGVYLIPDVVLSGDRFLDGRTLADVAAAANAPLLAVPPSVEGIVTGVAG